MATPAKPGQVPSLRSETVAKILLSLCGSNVQADASLVQLVRSLISRTKMSTPVVCAALYYASRFKSRLGCSVHLVFVLCLMLANKYWDDSTFCSGSWAAVAKVSVKDLSRLEIVGLKILNYNLGLSALEWNSWLSVIISLSKGYQQQQQLISTPLYPLGLNKKPCGSGTCNPCHCPACSVSPRPMRTILPPASTFLCSPCSSPANEVSKYSPAGYAPLAAGGSLTHAYPSPVSTQANSSPLSAGEVHAQYSTISPALPRLLPPLPHPPPPHHSQYILPQVQKRTFSTTYGDDEQQCPPLKRRNVPERPKFVGRHTYCCPPTTTTTTTTTTGDVIPPPHPSLKPLIPGLASHMCSMSYHSSPKFYKQCGDLNQSNEQQQRSERGGMMIRNSSSYYPM